jgi:hypothetical protein
MASPYEEQANAFKAKYMEMQRKLQKDIRPMIAKSGFFDPDKDNDEYVYQRYPITVRDAKGNDIGIANNEAEEKALLGVKQEPAKAVDVDVAKLVTANTPEVAPARRGRPPKAKSLDLPPNLE